MYQSKYVKNVMEKTVIKLSSPRKFIKFQFRYHLLLHLTRNTSLHRRLHPAPPSLLFLAELVAPQTT